MKAYLKPQLTRRRRIEIIVARLTDIYTRRSRDGQSVAHLMARSRKLSAAYLAAE
jgi:urease gamma subunit